MKLHHRAGSPAAGYRRTWQNWEQIRNAKREIDQFFGDLEGSTGSGSVASERLFVAHTDSVGHEEYNYEHYFNRRFL